MARISSSSSSSSIAIKASCCVAFAVFALASLLRSNIGSEIFVWKNLSTELMAEVETTVNNDSASFQDNGTDEEGRLVTENTVAVEATLEINKNDDVRTAPAVIVSTEDDDFDRFLDEYRFIPRYTRALQATTGFDDLLGTVSLKPCAR